MEFLRKNKRQIGVIIPASIDFGRGVLRGVRAWCTEQRDFNMVVVSELGYVTKMAFPDRTLDALVVQYSVKEDLEALRHKCSHVVVTSNRETVDGFARVLNDDRAIGRMGAEYLMSLGYRSLAFVQAQNLQFSDERAVGFTEAVQQEGLSCRMLVASSPAKMPEVIESLLALPGPVAVMAASDLHARWIIDALQEPLDVIPHRLAVLGVDDDSLQNALSPIPISSVVIAGERVGYEAAALGMRMAAGEPPPPEPIRIAPKFVVRRQSTDAIGIKDRVVSRTLRTIREHMAECRDVNELVHAIGVPRRTLEKRFRKFTGRSLADDLSRARIERARELLSSSNLSVKEIAYLVGFSEPRMLTLVFKRLTGELPSDFKARVLPGK